MSELLEYVKALAWPVTALTAMFAYRRVIIRLLPGSKVTMKMFGFSIERSLPEIEELVTERLGGRSLNPEQMRLLKSLADSGRAPFDRAPASQNVARPLRNAGLIISYPDGLQLAEAESIELTGLGRLIVVAAGNSFLKWP